MGEMGGWRSEGGREGMEKENGKKYKEECGRKEGIHG